MTSNRKADLMSLNAIAPLHAPSHCNNSASLLFAEIVTTAGRLQTVVSAGAPSFFKRSSAPLPTRNRTPLAVHGEGESGSAERRCLFYPPPTLAAWRVGTAAQWRSVAAPPLCRAAAALKPLPSAPKGGALISFSPCLPSGHDLVSHVRILAIIIFILSQAIIMIIAADCPPFARRLPAVCPQSARSLASCTARYYKYDIGGTPQYHINNISQKRYQSYII